MNQMVSIIVPCYNCETTVDRCIQSIYMQECDLPLELIVVNDGSTDQSKDRIINWISIFAGKGFVLKYIEQENQGPGGAVNTGLKYVSGKYLSLLDSDDCFLPGSIQKRVDFLENNIDFVGVRTNGWQDRSGQRKLFDLDSERTTNWNLFDGLIGGKATNWAGSYMIRTENLFDFYPTRDIYPSRYGQHMQILLPVAYKNKFGYIDEPLMIYYLQENSHSQSSLLEEQYEKNNRNFYGYQDIYRHMVNEVVKDKNERDYYINIIDSWKYKHELNKALLKKDEEKIKRFYKDYRATGRMTQNERIEYYSVMNPLVAFCLKVYRRCLMLVNRIKGK